MSLSRKVFQVRLRVLLGSCGGLTGLYLSKLLRKISWAQVEILGFDTEKAIPTKFFLDRFFTIPHSKDEEAFINALLQLLTEEKVDIYLPLHSLEVRTVSKYEGLIKSKCNTKFVVSPYETFLALDNKLSMYLNLSKVGIKVPKLYDTCPDDEEFPIFYKPASGSGSKGVMVLKNREQYELTKKAFPNGLYLEYLEGKEYTVDAIFDLGGRLLGYNQRVRLKTLGGAATVTKNDFSVNIDRELKLIETNFLIKGPANFQFFHTNKGEIVFTDVNLRFASGGLPLTVTSGLNIPEIVLKLLVGAPVDPSECVPDRKPRIMYRYFEEIYDEEIDHLRS